MTVSLLRKTLGVSYEKEYGNNDNNKTNDQRKQVQQNEHIEWLSLNKWINCYPSNNEQSKKKCKTYCKFAMGKLDK